MIVTIDSPREAAAMNRRMVELFHSLEWETAPTGFHCRDCGEDFNQYTQVFGYGPAMGSSPATGYCPACGLDAERCQERERERLLREARIWEGHTLCYRCANPGKPVEVPEKAGAPTGKIITIYVCDECRERIHAEAV